VASAGHRDVIGPASGCPSGNTGVRVRKTPPAIMDFRSAARRRPRCPESIRGPELVGDMLGDTPRRGPRTRGRGVEGNDDHVEPGPRIREDLALAGCTDGRRAGPSGEHCSMYAPCVAATAGRLREAASLPAPIEEPTRWIAPPQGVGRAVPNGYQSMPARTSNFGPADAPGTTSSAAMRRPPSRATPSTASPPSSFSDERIATSSDGGSAYLSPAA
jgi:hypothetical protein